MDREKVETLLQILKDLPYFQWENLKREIDNIYEIQRKKNVPNLQLGTLEENLNHWCDNLSKYKI